MSELYQLFCSLLIRTPFQSVHEKIRAFSPEYNYTGDFLLSCFYTNFKGNIDQPEKGFLKSSLLVKVCHISSQIVCVLPIFTLDI